MLFSHKFISANTDMDDYYREAAAPYMRRSFVLEDVPLRAELTLTALGFYRLFVNGRELTRSLLAPYITNPEQLVVYDRYDLTQYLKKGKNTLAFMLGNGFQNNYGGFIWLFHQASYRSAPKLAFALELFSGDTKEIIEADEKVLCHPSALIMNDLRVGVRYDARLSLDGWYETELDDSDWQSAISVLPAGGECVLSEISPVVYAEERRPVAIFREDDAFIYDFGINDTGLTRLTVKAHPGQKITILHGETLIDGKFSQENILFTKTNKKAIGMPAYTQRTEYIAKGEGVECYVPDFTFYGFRYARVEGITEEQATPELLTYLPLSTELGCRGGFECSLEEVNRLEEMSRRSTVSNFVHFPMDCPHREKNGWTGDAAASAEHTMLRFAPENNYLTWLRAICAAQDSRGAIPGIVPTAGWGFEWGNGPAWDRVMVELPYSIYVTNGDLSAARIVSSSVMKYFSYLYSRMDERGLLAIGLGDWLAPKNEYMPPLAFTDSTITYDMAKKAAVLFRAMGRGADADYAEALAGALRKAIREHLLDRSSMRFAGGSQSSAAMALYYGLCDNEDEKKKALSVLLEEIEKHDGHISTGFLGGYAIFRVLAEYGYTDLALKMITREDPPSWGVMLREGYTCLSECITGKLQSLNHHIFAFISTFFIKDIAGLRPNPHATDLTELEIAPHFPEGMEHASAYHNAPLGRIDVAWKRRGSDIALTLTIPEGMHGRVKLPRGFRFENGETTAEAAGGEYLILRA